MKNNQRPITKVFSKHVVAKTTVTKYLNYLTPNLRGLPHNMYLRSL